MPRQKKDSKEKHTGKFFVSGLQNSVVPPPPPDLPTNKPVSLGDKTDEEIISNTKYQFSIDINTLLNNSKTTRRSQYYPNEPPRPQNAFMLYRRDKAKYLKENSEKKTKQSKFSEEIGPMWKNESPEVKELFRALARTSEMLHSRTHGSNYRYSPRRQREQNQQNRRNRRKKNNETSSSHSNSDIDVDSPSSIYTPDSPSSDYSDMSNMILPDVSNFDDEMNASSSINFSSFGNNNISSYANFNVMSSVSPVEQGLPASVLQVPDLNEKEFCRIFWIAYQMYMNLKSKRLNSNTNEVASNTPPEFSEPDIEEYFDLSSFSM